MSRTRTHIFVRLPGIRRIRPSIGYMPRKDFFASQGSLHHARVNDRSALRRRYSWCRKAGTLRQGGGESHTMNQLHQSQPRLPERFWLHRTQWRTVAALMLLLAVVVASLALASGFWWALHVHSV